MFKISFPKIILFHDTFFFPSCSILQISTGRRSCYHIFGWCNNCFHSFVGNFLILRSRTDGRSNPEHIPFENSLPILSNSPLRNITYASYSRFKYNKPSSQVTQQECLSCWWILISPNLSSEMGWRLLRDDPPKISGYLLLPYNLLNLEWLAPNYSRRHGELDLIPPPAVMWREKNVLQYRNSLVFELFRLSTSLLSPNIFQSALWKPPPCNFFKIVKL